MSGPSSSRLKVGGWIFCLNYHLSDFTKIGFSKIKSEIDYKALVFSALSMSLMMSSICSKPTLTRTKLFVMPTSCGLFGQFGVGRACRVRDDAAGIAEVGGERAQLDAVQKTAALLQPTP